MYNCNQNFINIIQSLLKRAHDIDKKNSDGETALHLDCSIVQIKSAMT